MDLQRFSLETYLKELEVLVNIDSGSRMPEGTGAVAEWFAERFQTMGWAVKKRDLGPDVGPGLEIRNQPEGAIDLLLIGHMDTVFGPDETQRRPFKKEGNHLTGPGVYDMKASLLSGYYAVRLLQEANELGDLSICLAFNPDEEISSTYSRSWIEELGKITKRAIVMEPARANGAMVNARKGVGRFSIDFLGVPAHAGVAPEKGASATEELAHWLLALHSLTDYEKGTTLNAGVIQGGTVSNVVAEKAHMAVDLRVKYPEEALRVEAKLKELQENPFNPRVQATVSGSLTRPPLVPTAETLKFCDEVTAIGEAVGVKVEWIFTGGGSDANLLAPLNVPVIDGMGPVGGDSHSAKEYVEVDSIEPRLKLLGATIRMMAQNK